MGGVRVGVVWIRARMKYREFTEEGLRVSMESPLTNLQGQGILGGEGFIEEVKKRIRGKRFRPEIVERKRFMEYPGIEEVVGGVARAFGVKEKVICGKSGRAKMARKVALYFAQRYAGVTNGVIGKFFGGIQDSTVSKAAPRLKEEMISDKKLSTFIDQIESTFKA